MISIKQREWSSVGVRQEVIDSHEINLLHEIQEERGVDKRDRVERGSGGKSVKKVFRVLGTGTHLIPPLNPPLNPPLRHTLSLLLSSVISLPL